MVLTYGCLNKFRCSFDDNGEPEFIEGVVVDITAQHIAERDLEKSQGLMSKIYNGTRDAMILLQFTDDKKFRIVSGNVVFKKKDGIKRVERRRLPE